MKKKLTQAQQAIVDILLSTPHYRLESINDEGNKIVWAYVYDGMFAREVTHRVSRRTLQAMLKKGTIKEYHRHNYGSWEVVVYKVVQDDNK